VRRAGDGPAPATRRHYSARCNDDVSADAPVLHFASFAASHRRRKSIILGENVVRMDAGGARSMMQNCEPMLRTCDRAGVSGTQLELAQ